MNITDLGEFGLIDRIKKCVTTPQKFVIIGIGDDTAVLEAEDGNLLLFASDTLVEGVHFKREHIPFCDVGWRAMAANVSDIAAMGGEPVCALVSLCLSKKMDVEDVEALYSGMDRVGSEFGCPIIGGDTTSSPDSAVISISVLGRTNKERLTLRSGAHIGDTICLTGALGGSKAGLELLSRTANFNLDSADIDYLKERYRRPYPRISEAFAMGDVASIHAAIDISDGLSSEMNHICRESNKGAQIFSDKVPIHSATRQVAAQDSSTGMEYALSGGEDFELLFTLGESDVQKVKSSLQERTGTPMSVIGNITDPKEGIHIVYGDGKKEKLESSGYRHFAD